MNWKSLALLTLIASTSGVEAHERLRRGAVQQHVDPSSLPLEWESPPAIVLPENVEEVNWFVDKEGRRFLTEDEPVTELVAQTFVLQFMEAALVFSGLANMLNGNGPFTMMLTWDYEWERQPWVDKLKNAPWRRHLREMVEYCIHEGNVHEDYLPAAMDLYMMNGESLATTFDGQRSRIEGFRNIGTTPVSNGFVYLLQDILLPSFMSYSLHDLISSDHSVFAGLLVGAGLHTALDNTAETVGYTVFAPTNTAFDKYNTGFVNYLNSNSNERRAFCQYHMAEPVFPTMNMYTNSNTPITTKQGGQLTMRLSSAGVLTITAARSTATVLTMDKLAYNGLIHVVDTVLRHKNYNGISAPSALNVRNHVRGAVDSTAVFNDSNSYQSRALNWVVGSCPNCGRDGKRIMQRFVLACIYYATNNVRNTLTDAVNNGNAIGQWRRKDGWITTADECTWSGVECNDSGYVDSIILRDNRLSGTFPAETKYLQDSLEILDLTKNSMYNDGAAGNDWLGDLSKLKYLSVSQTGFSYNGIPPAIGRLRELTDLDVSYCLYFGPLQSNVFTNLDKCTYLDISGNSYNSAAPSTIGTMSSLLYFYAIDADLTGNLNFITSSTSLQELWIDDNQSLGGNIPTTLGNMISLRSLSLADNNLNGAIPSHLGRLLNMEQMFLYGNSFSGNIPSHLGNLEFLERLELYDNNIGGSMPNQVCNLSFLDDLQADCAGTNNKVRCTCCDCCNNNGNCRRSDEK